MCDSRHAKVYTWNSVQLQCVCIVTTCVHVCVCACAVKMCVCVCRDGIQYLTTCVH